MVATEAQDRMPREAENASRLPSTDIQAQPSPVLWAPHRAVIKVLAMDVVPSRWPGEGLHFPSGCRPPATLSPASWASPQSSSQRGSRLRRSKDSKTRFLKPKQDLTYIVFIYEFSKCRHPLCSEHVCVSPMSTRPLFPLRLARWPEGTPTSS